MKKIVNILIKLAVGIIIFIVAVGFFNKFKNKDYENLAAEMKDAYLPFAYIKYDDIYINAMHGYTSPVDTTLLRESITPVDESKKVYVIVEDKTDFGESYSYELRSIAGDSLIEDGKPIIENLDGNTKSLEINITMDIQPDMEYMLIVKIENNEEITARYYTRIVLNNNYHANLLLRFVNDMHELTFDTDVYKEDSPLYQFQKDYNGSYQGMLEDYGLGHVNLSSSYEAITWNGLKPMIITSIIPTIKEIDSYYAVIELEYKMMTNSLEDVSSYYTTKEFYQVSYNEGDIRLLNFDRYVDEYFGRNDVDSLNNVYEIGIVSDPFPDYRFSSDNKKLAFVRNGQLWMYNYSKNQISLVYSFWLDDFENATNTYDNYDINIISMDDDANITFAVYGYMNRGVHEGKLGIGLYKFSADSLILDELLFVETNVPYEVMKNQLSKLTYYDGTNFFFTLGNKVTRIDIEKEEISYLVDGVSANSIYASANMEVIAYNTSDIQTENNKIVLINLKTGNSYDITSKANECLICYGFKDSDLIYGISEVGDKDIIKDMKSFESTRLLDDNKDTIPATKVCIIDENGEKIKEYKKDDFYIAQVEIETDLLYLTRCKKQEGSFVSASDDFITFKADDENPGIRTEFRTSNEGFYKLYFTVPEGIYLTYKPNLNITKSNISSKSLEMVVSIPNDGANYMVYDNLGLAKIYEVAGDAINYAVLISGIVISKNGEVVYRQKEAEEYNTIASAIFHQSSRSIDASLYDCLYMVLNYQGADVTYNNLKELTDAVEILDTYGRYEGADITGLDLGLVLSYVGNSIPVISRITDGRYVLIVSYNSVDIRYYDPVIDEEVVTSREEYERMMEQAGSVMYSYIRN